MNADPKTHALFEQAIIRADAHPDFQKFVFFALAMGIIDVNYTLQFEGAQSGKGTSQRWIELIDGNYLR